MFGKNGVHIYVNVNKMLEQMDQQMIKKLALAGVGVWCLYQIHKITKKNGPVVALSHEIDAWNQESISKMTREELNTTIDAFVAREERMRNSQ